MPRLARLVKPALGTGTARSAAVPHGTPQPKIEVNMQVVIRAIRLLSAIGEAGPRGLSLTELATTLELPSPTAHRLLKVLVAEGMAYRDPQSLLYFPGEKMVTMARPRPAATLADQIRPHLRQLSDRFDETVFLTQLVGPRAVCVALAESQRPLRISVEVGREMPLHASVAARVLLAFRDDDLVRDLLDGYQMSAFTPKTPTSTDDVLKRLGVIRNRGYEMSSDELDRNIWAVAVPVWLHDGVAASLTIVAPVERSVDEEHRAEMLDAARETASLVQRGTGTRATAR
ncbi:IclR family transcriptional regulator [Nocardioides hungaricus]